MQNITKFSKEELIEELKQLSIPSYKAKQIWNWIYFFGVVDFEKMTNISKAMQATLKEKYTIERLKIIKDLISKDGTRKWLLELLDGETIEVVFIPAEDRGTLCISSQVGCAMKCKFCNTGTQGFTRNLEVDEVMGQVLVARDCLGEWENLNQAIGNGRKISNIVVMGMGEPLLNYDNMIKALKIMNDPDGIAFSSRRITLSTCGIVSQIYKLADDLKVNLAISLHASNDRVREKIMPIAEKYSLEDLMKALKFYSDNTSRRRITFEYIMIKDLNDYPEDAEKLLYLIRKYKIPAKINLIPFNYWNGCEFRASSSIKNIEKFAEIITNAKIPCPIRFSKGSDIMAACGQLKSSL